MDGEAGAPYHGPMRPLLLLALLPLGACAALQASAPAPGSPSVAASAAPPPALDPTPPPPPPAGADTADELDTTTEEDRAAAVAPPPDPAAAASLGTTVASLGPPADPGIWMETPLVAEPTMGRVVYPANGRSVTLELRPSGGAAGSGSQISLAAMRLLEAPLTGLLELEVFGS